MPTSCNELSVYKPIDRDLALDLFEFRIAGHQMRFPLFRERGGEAIGKGHFVLGFEVTSVLRWIPISIDEFHCKVAKLIYGWIGVGYGTFTYACACSAGSN